MKRVIYHLGKLNEKEEWRLDFLDGLSRSVEERLKLGFLPLKLPVMVGLL